MLLRSPARRWLSADVQPDLVLTCDDGRVPAHAALLASSSNFLSALLSAPSSLHCAGCSSPRSLLLSGVKEAEASALVELLYTGKAPYTRDVASLLGLCDMLGLCSMPSLCGMLGLCRSCCCSTTGLGAGTAS